MSVQTEFQSRRRMLIFVVIAVAVVSAVVMFLLYADVLGNPALLAVFVLCAVLGLVANLKLWRCPSCGGHLGKLYLGLPEPRHCPRCGIELMPDADR